MPLLTSPRPGDVLLLRGQGALSDLIAFLDGAGYSHSAIVYDADWLVEATAPAVRRSRIADRLPEYPAGSLRRLTNPVATMRPVLDRADYYVGQGARFAYEALVLLGLLCATRRFPLLAAAGPLLVEVFDAVTTLISEWTHEHREPMVCSELVYRCFDEADPDPIDEYTLRVDVMPHAVTCSGGSITGARALRGRGIAPRSLLSDVLSLANSTNIRLDTETWEPLGAWQSHEARRVRIEALASEYLRQVREAHVERLTAFEILREPAVTESLARFVNATRRALIGVESWERRVAPASTPTALCEFMLSTADFVTPGDLAGTESLHDIEVWPHP